MGDKKSNDAAEAAAIRRRWISLGEAVAVIAVLISGLTLWNSYSERSHNESERQAESHRAETKARTLVLKGTAERDGDRIALSVLGEQAVQTQTIAFPEALGIDPVETADQEIDAGWFDDALKKARRAAGKDDETKRDERLPVAITTRYVSDGELVTDVSVYDIGYKLEGRFLQGSAVRLRGLSLVGRTSAKAAQGRIDALWKARAGRVGK